LWLECWDSVGALRDVVDVRQPDEVDGRVVEDGESDERDVRGGDSSFCCGYRPKRSSYELLLVDNK
jgi:hypothetical protein